MSEATNGGRRGVTRRQVVRGAVGALALVALLPRRAFAAESRRLRLVHTHTDERLDVTYFEDGEHVPGALEAIDRFLRDFRTGDVHAIDPGVLDIAWALALAVERPLGTFEIVSGYRSPATNALLHERSRGAARHSLHVDGRALDLRLRGVTTTALRDAAVALGRGGVGYYAVSDFVHVDTGRVRRW